MDRSDPTYGVTPGEARVHNSTLAARIQDAEMDLMRNNWIMMKGQSE